MGECVYGGKGSVLGYEEHECAIESPCCFRVAVGVEENGGGDGGIGGDHDGVGDVFWVNTEFFADVFYGDGGRVGAEGVVSGGDGVHEASVPGAGLSECSGDA